jgi:glycosyltransferase involved in cell wall biosynthesis
MNLVSVITTFKNSQETISDTINSVLNQTYENFEYILVDDGSEDHSLKILKSFDDKRIKILEPGNIGRANALNEAVNISKGEYIAIIDADDICINNRLEKQINFCLMNNKDFVATNSILVNFQGDFIGQTNFVANKFFLKEKLLEMNPFAHSSIFIKKNVLNEIGKYDNFFKKSIDFNMYLQMIIAGYDLYFIEEPLIKLRVYEESWGKSDIKYSQFYFGFFGLINLYIYEKYGINIIKEDLKKRDLLFKLYEKWFFKLKIYRKPKSKKYLKSFYESLFKKGNIIQSTSLFIRAIMLYPFFWKLYKSSVFSYEFDVQKFIKHARSRNQEINLFFEKLNEKK